MYFTPSSGKSEGFLQNLPKGDKPFTTLHIDHLAPISRTHSQKRKYRYIFLVVDAFSKFVKLYAVKSTNASEVIKCLKSYFEHYSQPLYIISDRGFVSCEFEEFIKMHNVQHIKIATASPQANGQVERINRTILPMIAKLADERSVQWHCVLEDVEFACNNTISKATNECPSITFWNATTW